MTRDESAATNEPHEDDDIDRRVADQPTIAPNKWVKRAAVAIVIVAVAYVLVLIAGAFFPRWWAQRVADQVNGGVTRGTLWGLFYGFSFTLIPLLLLFQIRRHFLNRKWKAIVAAVAVALAAPNWLTLSVVAGNSSAAHAGERIFDVDAPGFRAATLIGVIVGVVLAVGITGLNMRLKYRKKEIARLRGERDELKRSREDEGGQ